MKICVIFLLIFLIVGIWSERSDVIIFDTNVCSATIKLFKNLREKIIKESSGTVATYKDIWSKFNGSANLVEDVLSGYLNETEKRRHKSSIFITKLMLDLKENRPQTEIHIPVYIYNEAKLGKSSKISKNSTHLYEGYEELFQSIPVKIVVDDRVLINGKDYPNKNSSADPETMFQIIKGFLSNAVTSDKNLENLIKYLSEDIENKMKQTANHLSDLNEMCENVQSKISLWDKQMKVFLSNNGVCNYKSETEQLLSVAGRISTYHQNLFKEINFSDAIDVIANRLIKFKEEFDFFDLQIYLIAKEMNAKILTVNTQAFQEINDPVFLDFFRETKIVNPTINFKELNDLDRPYDCKSVMQATIENDFENDYRILTNLKSICNLHRENFNVTELRFMFNNIFNEIRKQQKDGIDLKVILKEIVFADALDLIKIVDHRVKIDQQAAFNTDSTKVILLQMNALNFIAKFIYNSTLNVDDFVRPQPSIDSVPPSLRFNRDLAEGVKHGLSNDNHNLIEFLNLFKVRPMDKSSSVEAVKYAKMIYFESNFERECLIRELGII